jgi:hypothetical protein
MSSPASPTSPYRHDAASWPRRPPTSASATDRPRGSEQPPARPLGKVGQQSQIRPAKPTSGLHIPTRRSSADLEDRCGHRELWAWAHRSQIGPVGSIKILPPGSLRSARTRSTSSSSGRHPAIHADSTTAPSVAHKPRPTLGAPSLAG